MKNEFHIIIKNLMENGHYIPHLVVNNQIRKYIYINTTYLPVKNKKLKKSKIKH